MSNSLSDAILLIFARPGALAVAAGGGSVAGLVQDAQTDVNVVSAAALRGTSG
jgi:hypothetical protein